ncbi:hypothetical protein Ancab_016504 [Ancistrocladus abbreviatus]
MRGGVAGPPTPPPLSQEEILRRRRNQEEVRNVYQNYKTIKRCAAASKADARLMPELEQAYLSLITASRGCTSVQRIVSELIPRYASFCPTALEAAAQVVINMHNWSLPVVTQGEDVDGIAFETAKNCIAGLVDICSTASSEEPTSSVIQGICSTVFLNVLTFFASSFEGKDIFQIIDKEALEMQDSADLFAQLKQMVSEGNGSASLGLLKLRALSLLQIFFSCPKNAILTCFELVSHPSTGGICKEGKYLLSQLFNGRDYDTRNCGTNKESGGCEASTSNMEVETEGNSKKSKNQGSNDDHVTADASEVSKNSLFGQVLKRDPSLKKWIFSRYKKLCNSAPSEAVSEVRAALVQIFGSFTVVEIEENKEDSDEDSPDPSKYVDSQYLRISNQRKSSSDVSGRGITFQVHDGSCNDDMADKVSGHYLKRHNSIISLESDHHSNTSSNHESGGSKSMDFESKEQGDVCYGRYSMPRDLLTNQLFSPRGIKSLDSRTDPFEGGGYAVHVEKTQGPNMDSLRYSSGVVGSVASRNHMTAPYPPTANQTFWYTDGDPAAMDVFSASRQLWLGCLPSDASEASVKFHVERFGPIENFSFFPVKGFALVQYRSMMDAIKARECMRGQSPWGIPVRVKFMDIGLGTRGFMNGVAIGYSCHVYVGNVFSQWAKDEILHEMMKVVHKGPRAFTELASEAALLLEFETAEEAAGAMACLRQHRKRSNNFTASFAAAQADMPRSHMSFGGQILAPVSTMPGNMCDNIQGSVPSQIAVESPADRMRMSHLSSFLSSLRKKYSIPDGLTYFDNHGTGNCHAATMKEEDSCPTNTLWICLSNVGSQCLTDDEVMTICNLAVGKMGSVLRLSQASMQMGGWSVECSSIDAAVTLSKNLGGCPGSFFKIEFCRHVKHITDPLTMMLDSGPPDFASPRASFEKQQATVHAGHIMQSNWSVSGRVDAQDVGTKSCDSYGNTGVVAPSQGMSEQMWMHRKPELELHSAPGLVTCMPMAAPRPTIAPAQQIRGSPLPQPVYPPPNGSWDAQLHLHLNTVPPGVMPSNLYNNAIPPPFIPASVTPLSQLQGHGVQQHNPIVPQPIVPPLLPCIPPPKLDIAPPLPPSPPTVPPPPSSPPPPPPPPLVAEPLNVQSAGTTVQSSGTSVQSGWQGSLSKSGVHYCSIYALRIDSEICKYSNAISEPMEWPAKLDMTKRTDFRHVKSTFGNTPPHKREVCQLLPSSPGDNKGFQDFISYLKQRECAGVIKIPAVKSVWARLLFILPYSPEACSLLSVAPNQTDCLIAVVLPKETNNE